MPVRLNVASGVMNVEEKDVGHSGWGIGLVDYFKWLILSMRGTNKPSRPHSNSARWRHRLESIAQRSGRPGAGGPLTPAQCGGHPFDCLSDAEIEDDRPIP